MPGNPDLPASADIEVLRDFYLHLAAAEFDGYCEPYAQIARGLAGDTDMLQRIASLGSQPKLLPVLVLAAVHDLVLQDPSLALAAVYRGEGGDAWPRFRDLLVERFDAVQALTATRVLQTNEVGRTAPVVSALTALHRRFERPLALIEIGTSAGLNLLLDRFGFELGREGDPQVRGAPKSPIRLRCEWRGPLQPPLDAELPPLAAPVGIDVRPVDVRREDDRRWLRACVWPTVPDRAAQLDIALDLAVAHPPDVRAGDAVDTLAAVVDEVPDGVVPCVLSLWVLAYLAPERRAELTAVLDALGTRRDLACITAEYPGVVPWSARPERSPTGNPDTISTVLGLAWWQRGHRGVATAGWMQGHGRWLDWLDADSAD